MATVTRYVNTASSGGDGTTNNTSGATAAYASLLTWASSEAAAFIAGSDHHVVICTGGEDAFSNSNIDFSTWTTSATKTLLIRSDDTRTAASRLGGYHITANLSESFAKIQSYTTVRNIVIHHSNGGGVGRAFGIETAESNILFDRCRLYKTGEGYYNGIFLSAASDGTTAEAHNCIIESANSAGTNVQVGINLDYSSGSTLSVRNCTIAGWNGTNHKAMLHVAASTINMRNCAVFNNAADTDAQEGATTSWEYSATDDTISGTGNIDWTAEATDWAAAVTDYANGDFSVKDASSDLYNAGTDLSGSGVTVDLLGTARPQASTYDIGAFELVVASLAAGRMLLTGVG